jgi:asparagine synthetase B (glutamine-hydrolysing)
MMQVYVMHLRELIDRQAYPPINRSLSSTLHNLEWDAASAESALLQQLLDSIRLRLKDLPKPKSGHGSRLAILFSGGLDCTVLARLCHDLLPSTEPIDLLNVAFENPRIATARTQHDGIDVCPLQNLYAQCPDRVTGISSYSELTRTCPERIWNFLAIDIPYSEVQSHRSQVIELMLPHNTEMDLSISLALYFASRGIGNRLGPDGKVAFASRAKVLLSGLGADELFGGYTRHEVAYTKRGEKSLIDELELDFKRIAKRNLGRDDRIISHWGKEIRYPFLDEKVVAWALERPSWEKYGFLWGRMKLPESAPTLQNVNKLVLRLLAWHLGVRGAADEKKRAIQFGARTAKMQNGKSKGTSIVHS